MRSATLPTTLDIAAEMALSLRVESNPWDVPTPSTLPVSELASPLPSALNTTIPVLASTSRTLTAARAVWVLVLLNTPVSLVVVRPNSVTEPIKWKSAAVRELPDPSMSKSINFSLAANLATMMSDACLPSMSLPINGLFPYVVSLEKRATATFLFRNLPWGGTREGLIAGPSACGCTTVLLGTVAQALASTASASPLIAFSRKLGIVKCWGNRPLERSLCH